MRRLHLFNTTVDESRVFELALTSSSTCSTSENDTCSVQAQVLLASRVWPSSKLSNSHPKNVRRRLTSVTFISAINTIQDSGMETEFNNNPLV